MYIVYILVILILIIYNTFYDVFEEDKYNQDK